MFTKFLCHVAVILKADRTGYRNTKIQFSWLQYIHDETVCAHYNDNASTVGVNITALTKITTARRSRPVNSAVKDIITSP